MEDSIGSSRIVVGVTGPGQETGALSYAAERARSMGSEVLVVHAYHLVETPPPDLLTSNETVKHVALKIVEAACEEVGELSGGAVQCRALARPGQPARVLVQLARGARMIVVQHRESRLPGWVFVGSTAAGAAAHAPCPVFSVPTDWAPGRETGEGPAEIVVGIHGEGEPRHVLEAAIAEASAAAAPLRVLHAWRLDAAYDDIITMRVKEEWRAEQERLLMKRVEELRRAHPEVTVQVDVRHQWPAQALVEASGAADLVVVGRHGRRGWLPERLGSVARTVLREARAPVMVVPVDPRETAGDDWALVADEVSPQ